MKDIKELIVECAPETITVLEINEQTNLINDLGYDSLCFVQLISLIEEEFNIYFDIDDLNLDILSTFEGLKNIVDNMLS